MVWRAFPSVAWTGTEVIVAGGSNGPGVEPLAVAYNPSTEEWRELPGPPGIEAGLSANEVTDGVWTGTELISWNSRLAFDPRSETWRTINPSPLSERSWAAVAATDDGVFVWGGCSPRPDGQCDEVLGGDELTDGALYDPEADMWKPVATSPLGPGDHPTALWTGTEVIVNVPAAVDPDAPSVAAYNPSTDTWRVLPDPPQPTGMYTEAAWTGRFYVLHGGLPDGPSDGGAPSGATSVLDLEDERWYRLPEGPARGPHTAVAIGPTSVVIAGGHDDASPWLLEFDEPAPARRLDFGALGPIRLGMTIEEAEEASDADLLEVETFDNGCVSYEIAGEAAFIAQDGTRIRAIIVTGSAVSTARGIGVGDSHDAVVAAYADLEPDAQPDQGKQMRISVISTPVDAPDLELVFDTAPDGTVESVRTGYAHEAEVLDECLSFAQMEEELSG